ncbi:DUF3301 domain-containing protein [Salinibius halmophilus]|uniref:DUF3301 domain-containing protein n=1 Tax=Salinibius halmophilus TaxID=1853216 RepID=UPI000E66F0BF|nr:DUF3301 domain-containing protein [Salinibius halmophilus]
MSLSALSLLLLIAFVILLWWQHTGFFHRARQLAQSRCLAEGIQLLDDSVAFDRFKVLKTDVGWRLSRVYEFEFTSTGKARFTGKLFLIGNSLYASELEPYDLAQEDDEQ